MVVKWSPKAGAWAPEQWDVSAKSQEELAGVDWGWLAEQLKAFARAETEKEEGKQRERMRAEEEQRAKEQAERQAQLEENARENERRELAYQAELAEAEAKEAERIARIVHLVLDRLGVES